MNYIELINRFWRLRRSMRITSLQTDVYFCLVQECNLRGWPLKFKITNKLLCITMGIAEPSLTGARRRLAQLELIRFTGGKRNLDAPEYEICPVPQGNTNNLSNPDGNPEDGEVEDGRHDASQGASPNIKQNKKRGRATGLLMNKKTEPGTFVPPTVEEVEAYCLRRRNAVDAFRFVDYYTSRGWMLGDAPMKNWKAVVRGWEKSPSRKERFASYRGAGCSPDNGLPDKHSPDNLSHGNPLPGNSLHGNPVWENPVRDSLSAESFSGEDALRPVSPPENASSAVSSSNGQAYNDCESKNNREPHSNHESRNNHESNITHETEKSQVSRKVRETGRRYKQL